ncbi:hypothetical protein HNV11_23285 [Spirosoma taeanense]|uniref:NlpE-like protein n=1 Tax=Spirosoma taeanense TaxID=2735870 RepID=A0A6M5YDN8_9BACT|nr:hypothetical protein [Spirosoma taeanense]QJW92089.1 hypothetical protein HNV11_23285 [Spirosoma taeanense]
MKLLVVALIFSVALGHCTNTALTPTPEQASADALTIRTGTSFGMCAGYCVHEYVINGTSVALTQSATRTQNQHPIRTCQFTINEADWSALKAAANVDAFRQQPERLGCPDCADGGAEFIELQLNDQKHRVTFEYGKTIPGFEPLVDLLRRQRTAHPSCK